MLVISIKDLYSSSAKKFLFKFNKVFCSMYKIIFRFFICSFLLSFSFLAQCDLLEKTSSNDSERIDSSDDESSEIDSSDDEDSEIVSLNGLSIPPKLILRSSPVPEELLQELLRDTLDLSEPLEGGAPRNLRCSLRE